MTVGVVIPWRSGCPHRARALAAVRAHIADHHPSFTVVLGETEGEWSKGAAVAAGVADLVDVDRVIAWDADVIVDPEAVRTALTTDSWAVPHYLVHRLSLTSTDLFLGGHDLTGLALDRTNGQDHRPYIGVVGGGITVLTADLMAAVPIDPRFVGWGQEDQAWSAALSSLAGAPQRGSADLVHLWHPPSPRKSRRVGSDENAALLADYKQARRPAQIRSLLADARRELVNGRQS